MKEFEFEENRIYDDLNEIARKVEFLYGKPGIDSFIDKFDELVTIWRELGYEQDQ